MSWPPLPKWQTSSCLMYKVLVDRLPPWISWHADILSLSKPASIDLKPLLSHSDILMLLDFLVKLLQFGRLTLVQPRTRTSVE